MVDSGVPLTLVHADVSSPALMQTVMTTYYDITHTTIMYLVQKDIFAMVKVMD